MKIEPAAALVGHVAVPGDKSISHRSVLIGSLAEGETSVRGFGRSGDTQATVDAGRYAELVHALDAGISFHPVACPRLVPLIEGEDPYGEETEQAVRDYAAPLQAEGVDTVILGCTHYPLLLDIR